MTNFAHFTHGYALLIGVDDNQVTRLRLPDVAKDVAALQEVLTHPDRCAYPPENIKTIKGSEATRSGILAGLKWLRERLEADANATAVVYYSGHGHCEERNGTAHFALIPYDIDLKEIEATGLAATVFASAIEKLQPQRLLVILDCCHAGGVEAKALEPGMTVLPVNIFAGSGGAKSVDAAVLQQGRGRTVLSSSQGSERSYMRLDGKMSLFTYHLIEALTGHAQPEGGATEIFVSDLVGHVQRKVPAAARAMQRAQNPDAYLDGNFAIALVLGGKGLAKGEAAPDPLAPISPTVAAPSVSNTGARAVTIGGSANNNTIVTGDRNVTGSNNQVTRIDTGGGPYVGRNVKVGGNFVGRDQVIQGDNVRGDKVQGDKINVGDISGSSVAIGRGAQAHMTQITQGLAGEDLEKLFANLYRQIETRHDDLAADRDELRETVERIEKELQKKEAANPDKVKRWLTTLSEVAPDIFKAVTQILTNPVAQVSGAIVGLVRGWRG